jgi:signal transduction histidine kinase
VGQIQKIDDSDAGASWPVRPIEGAESFSDGDSADEFERGIARFSSLLRQLPSEEVEQARRAALETLAQGFPRDRISLLQIERPGSQPGDPAWAVVASWNCEESGKGAPRLVQAVSTRALARDLVARPELTARLRAGEAVASATPSPGASGWRAPLGEALFLPCLAAEGLLGVIAIEADTVRGQASASQIRGGLLVAEILAAFLERRELEGQLALASERVRSDRSMAHDFNNLLTAILGYADLLGFEMPEGGIWQEDLAELQAAALSAAELVEQHLCGGRSAEAERPSLDLGERLESLRGTLVGVVGRDVEVEIQTEPDLPRVAFDATSFERIVLNLASNARDAICEKAKGTGHFRLTLGRCESPSGVDCLRLVASDDGAGIRSEARSRLFEPGWTTKPSGVGHGLGLASIASAMQEAGGQIRLDDTSSRGTSFQLDFPLSGRIPRPIARPIDPSAADSVARDRPIQSSSVASG